MAIYKGILHYSDLEGGFWQLQADDGENYQLAVGQIVGLKSGDRVVVEADDEPGFGIGMVGGGTLQVGNIQADESKDDGC